MSVKSSSFRPYTLKGKISGFVNNPVLVKTYKYILTQYTPSVYAEMTIIISNNDFESFRNIDKLKIESRIIQVWFESELYNENLKQGYNTGPFKYVIIDYQYENYVPDEVDTGYKAFAPSKLITLKCLDPIFYKMSLNDNIRSFGNATVSAIVNKLVSLNNGKIKTLVDTAYQYKWLQTQLTDYEMIRSMLPYSQSSNGDLLYTFFMFNEECYFGPISTNKIHPVKLNANNIDGSFPIYSSTDIKTLIEKYGSKDALKIYNHGYANYETSKAMNMTTQAYGNGTKGYKQHAGVANKFISSAIEDKKLNEIYLSNFRQRIFTFSRMMTLNNIITVPDITPLDCIEIVKDRNGEAQDINGVYYVISVTYHYGMTSQHPMQPSMDLVLASETDKYGIDYPEGKKI